MKAFTLCLGLMFISVAPVLAVEEHIMNFDHDKVGVNPKGWVSDGNPWPVADEQQASSLPHVLLPPRSVLSGGSLARLLVSSSVFMNGDVGVRFRTLREDPAALGVVWSYVDPANYEEIQINTEGGAYALNSVREGKSHQLANDSVLFTPNTWHLLQIRTSPKQIVVFLDNEIIATGKTSTRKKSGMVGLEVAPNSPVQFDDFAWRGE